MTTKIKTALLILFFLFAMLTGVQAQDKYEFAVASTFDITRLAVTKHTTEYLTFQKGLDPFGELIKKVEEMSKEGWEVYNSIPCFIQNGSVNGHVYYLRRKLKD